MIMVKQEFRNVFKILRVVIFKLASETLLLSNNPPGSIELDQAACEGEFYFLLL